MVAGASEERSENGGKPLGGITRHHILPERLHRLNDRRQIVGCQFGRAEAAQVVVVITAPRMSNS